MAGPDLSRYSDEDLALIAGGRAPMGRPTPGGPLAGYSDDALAEIAGGQVPADRPGAGLIRVGLPAAGATAGGALGSLAGPVGTAAGASLGSMAGEWIAQALGYAEPSAAQVGLAGLPVGWGLGKVLGGAGRTLQRLPGVADLVRSRHAGRLSQAVATETPTAGMLDDAFTTARSLAAQAPTALPPLTETSRALVEIGGRLPQQALSKSYQGVGQALQGFQQSLGRPGTTMQDLVNQMDDLGRLIGEPGGKAPELRFLWRSLATDLEQGPVAAVAAREAAKLARQRAGALELDDAVTAAIDGGPAKTKQLVRVLEGLKPDFPPDVHGRLTEAVQRWAQAPHKPLPEFGMSLRGVLGYGLGGPAGAATTAVLPEFLGETVRASVHPWTTSLLQAAYQGARTTVSDRPRR